MKAVCLLVLLFLNQIIFSFEDDDTDAICNGKLIKNCKECNSNEDGCAVCKDHYFLLLDECKECDDEIYGQIGCEGNCDGTNYKKNKFAFCEKGGCKEGYYNLNGFCFECDIGSPGCSNCTYEVQETETEGNFMCLECKSNEYLLTEKGTCEKCKFENCEICHYNKDNNVECDTCKYSYYKNSEGKCKSCRYITINGKQCKVCSDDDKDYDKDSCGCPYGYTVDDKSLCIKCSPGCSTCQFNSDKKGTDCLYCEYRYILNPDKECIYCGNGCNYCTLDDENKPQCLTCNSGYFLDNYVCHDCPRGCSKCNSDEKCSQCNSYYFLLNSEKSCKECSEISEGCEICDFNSENVGDEEEEKGECLKCNYDYAYIENTHKCVTNWDSNDVYLYGCLRAKFLDGKYECLECKSDFIQIFNDRNCRWIRELELFKNCLEVENLNDDIKNPEYSCHKCKNNLALITVDSTKKKKECFARKNNLKYCLEGEKDENGDYICSKSCVENAKKNDDNTCECQKDSFGPNDEFCYKCDDKDYGNQGCQIKQDSDNCIYIISNDELDCYQCKEGFFEYTRGQCFSCEDEIENCKDCNFDEVKGNLKCDKCLDNYYLNEKENICELDECKEYPERSNGCIICNSKFDEYKNTETCQMCEYGYFMTKEGKCEYCGSEKNGGPSCYECGYEEDEKGEETDNIICKNCYSAEKYYEKYPGDYYYDYYLLLKKTSNSVLNQDKKCYSCKTELSESCLNCEFRIGNNEERKLVCTLCSSGYYLNSDGKCESFIDKIEKIKNCKKYKFAINNFIFYYDTTKTKDYFESEYYSAKYINKILDINKKPLKSTCLNCEGGYYLNDDGLCESLRFEICDGYFIYKYNREYLYDCENLCYKNDYPKIYLALEDNSINFKIKDIKDITKKDTIINILNNQNFQKYDMVTKNEILNKKLCYKFTNDEEKSRLQGCVGVIWLEGEIFPQCVECKYGYNLDIDNHKCILVDSNIQHCKEYGDDKISCIECEQHYYLNKYGNCDICVIDRVIKDKECSKCDDIVENCYICEKDKSKKEVVLCKECKDQYILFEGENKCLLRETIDEKEKLDSCLVFTKNNDKNICKKCKLQFSLKTIDSETKCIYTPTLFDQNLNIENLFYHYSFRENYFWNYIESENINNYYYPQKQNDYFPCEKSENNGKNGNSLYSCQKCYSIFEDKLLDNLFLNKYDNYRDLYYDYYYDYDYDEYYYGYNYYYYPDIRYNWKLPTKINDKSLGISYCIKAKKEVEYCLDADYKIFNGVGIYSCNDCLVGTNEIYNKELGIIYCSYDKVVTQCSVKNCKECIKDNINFCKSCITSDLVVNCIGSCVKKTEFIPAVTWKDIYRLQMNSQKKINGKTIRGPSLRLRGITCSQINSRHAFLVYLTFKIKHSLRNLKEQIDMPAICEIENEVNETSSSINLVEYECIGNSTEEVDDNYELTSIGDDDSNSGTIINGNMKEINDIINLFDITKKEANYTLDNLDNIINFNIEQIIFYTNNNTLYIDGKINKKLSNLRILSQDSPLIRFLSRNCLSDISIDLNIPHEKEECEFCSDTDDLKAQLICKFSFKEGTDISNISLENREIKIGDNFVMMSGLRDDIIPTKNENDQKDKDEQGGEVSGTPEPATTIPKFNKKTESSSNKTTIIVVCTIVGIVVLGGLTALIIILKKTKAKKPAVENNSKITDPQVNDSYKSDINLDKAE